MGTTAKKNNRAKGSLRKLLVDEFFVVQKGAGVREGFRRLALLLGGAAFVWAYVNMQMLLEYVPGLGAALGMGMQIAGALIAIVAFFVVAAITKTIGWVIEGFK